MIKTIIFLCSSVNIGDLSNKSSILNELLQKTPIENIHTIDTDKEFSSISKEFLSFSNHEVIFSIGEKSLDFLHYLHNKNLLNSDKSYIAASIHQYDNYIKDLPLDYLAIPESTLNTDEKKQVINKIPKVTLTFSVPTDNPTIFELKESYEKWDITNKPNLEDDYIIIMLPGDAPDSNNKIKYFTKNSAKKLFDSIYVLWKNSGSKHKFIIHNGPRTGKYDQSTGKIVSSHDDNKIDEISEYFIELLNSSKMDFRFFNFNFETDGANKKSNSIYKQMLYIAQIEHKDNYFIMPGESVSMIGQIPLYIKPEKAILFKSSSMNKDHELIFNSAFNNNYISYFNDIGEIINPINPATKLIDDTKIIVQNLLEDLNLHRITN